MPSQWETFKVEAQGGLLEASSLLTQGEVAPGSLIQGQNYEASTGRGYRRIKGHEKYSSTALSGSGPVLGVFVLGNSVIGCRDNNIEIGTGGAWTSITTGRTGAGKYRGVHFNWVQESLGIVDSVNYPAVYLLDGTYTELTNAPQGAVDIAEFKGHMFVCKDSLVYYSAPLDYTNWSTGGAGSINLGSASIVGLQVFRDDLFIFGENSIYKLTGSSDSDFSIQPVTLRLGCIAADTIQEVAGNLYYLSQDGVRTIAATERIGDVEIGNKTRQVEGRVLDIVDKAYSNYDISSVVIPSKSQYRIFTGLVSELTSAATGLLGIVNRSAVLRTVDFESEWEWFDIVGINPSCANWGHTDTEELILHGDYSGYVHKQESSNAFDGSNISTILQFPYWSYGMPEIRKQVFRLNLFIRANGTTALALDNMLDYGDSDRIQPDQVDLTTLITSSLNLSLYGVAQYGVDRYNASSPVDGVPETALIGSCFNHSLKLTETSSNPPHTVDGFATEFRRRGRR